MQLPKERKILYLLIAAAAVIKLIMLFFIHDFRVWEENEMAKNYLTTGKMQYMHDGAMVYNYSLPVYPFLLIILYKIVGVSYKAAAILNIIFSAISGLLFYDVFNAFFVRFNLPEKVRSWQQKIVLLSVAAYLFHPLITFYEIKNVHPFAMYIFLYVLSLWLMVKYVEKSTWQRLTIFAFVLGLAILARPTLGAVIIPFFFWVLQKDKFKKTILKTGYVLVIAAIIPSIWVWNIYSNVKAPSILPNIGMGMWMGTLQQTEGSNTSPDGKTFYAQLSDSDLAAISKIPAASRDSFYRAKYMNTLKHNPGRVGEMFLVKFANFWLFRKAIGVDYPVWVQNLIPIYKVVYIVVLALALFAVFKIGKQALILMSFPFAVSLVHAAIYVEMRHRIMFEPILIFLAIIGIAMIRNRVIK